MLAQHPDLVRSHSSEGATAAAIAVCADDTDMLDMLCDVDTSCVDIRDGAGLVLMLALRQCDG